MVVPLRRIQVTAPGADASLPERCLGQPWLFGEYAVIPGHRVVEPAGPPQYSRLDQPRLGVLWLRPPRPGDQYERGIAVPSPSKHESDAEVRSKGHRIAGEYLL